MRFLERIREYLRKKEHPLSFDPEYNSFYDDAIPIVDLNSYERYLRDWDKVYYAAQHHQNLLK